MSYADLEDLASFGLTANATTGLDTTELERQLEAASSLADSYMGGRGYDLPIHHWGSDLRSAVARIAAWQVIVHHRGVNPSNPAHAALAKSHDDAIAWLRDVAAGKANLSGRNNQQRGDTGTIASFAVDSGEELRGW